MTLPVNAQSPNNSGSWHAPLSQLRKPLSLALPGKERTSLLRACLLSGDEGRDAWKAWLEKVGDPIAYLKKENEGVKGLLPLLFTKLAENGVEIEKTLQTSLRTAYLNEEVRSKSYSQICANVLSAFDRHGISLMVIKGADLAFTVYEHPVLRHTDGFDLLIEADDADSALDLLRALGCVPPPKPIDSAWRRLDCRHRSGLMITLNRQLFDLPFAVSGDEMWNRRRTARVAGVEVPVLSPADNLLYTCVGVYWSRIRVSLRWVCDAWFLVDRHEDVDWPTLLNFAPNNQMALPLSLTFDCLARDFGVSIPKDVISQLHEFSNETTMTGREVALSAARRSPRGGLKHMLRSAEDWPTRAGIVRWMLFPTAAYLCWAEGIRHGWAVPLRYLYRPLRYIVHRMGFRGSNG